MGRPQFSHVGSKVGKFYVKLPTRHTVNMYVMVELICNPLTSSLLRLEFIVMCCKRRSVHETVVTKDAWILNHSSGRKTLKITGNLQLLLLLPSPLPYINDLLNYFKRLRPIHNLRLLWTFGCLNVYLKERGRAVAQAVSRWLPTGAARVRPRVWSCGICGGQSGAGAGFLRVLRFPLQIFIPPISPQSPSSIIWGWYNRPVVGAVPSGLSLTPLIIIKNT
jgi:hypothetical protein